MGTSPMHVAIRADASVKIGHGHVIRCLALAEALRAAGARSTLVAAELPTALEHELAQERVAVIRVPPRATAREALRGLPEIDWIVVDHYGIDHAWESGARDVVKRVAVIDDLANRRHDADILLDPDMRASKERYAGLVSGQCRLLLGPRFMPLRAAFAERRGRSLRAQDNLPGRVVLFSGSGDEGNTTGKILDAWSLVGPERPALDVVIGAEHRKRREIERRAVSIGNVEVHVQTRRMAELLEDAQLFIGAAGGGNWERCCLGVPALMFAVAVNQESNLEQFARLRTGISLGRARDINMERLGNLIGRVLRRMSLLRRMGKRAAGIVDGHGAMRAALAMVGSELRLRDASLEDELMAWNWRNDARTRLHSRDARELPLEEHQRWWRAALGDPDRRLFIAHCGPRDVGVLRLDSRGGAAEVSIYVDPEFTGVGLGKAMLRAVQRWACGNRSAWDRLEAEILPGNRASRVAFISAGFQQIGSCWRWQIPGRGS